MSRKRFFKSFSVFIFSIALLLCLSLSSCDTAADECRHSQLTTTVYSPTCSEEGRTVRSCVDCDLEFVSDLTAPKGHVLEETVTPATCTDQGYTEFSCTCGYSFKSSVTPPKGHNLTSKLTKNTCTESGHTTYTCTVCAYSYVADFKAPAGHSFTARKVLPTCDTTGYTSYTCECGYSYIGDYLFYSDIFGGAYSAGSNVLAKGIDVSKYNHTYIDITNKYLPLDWNKIKAEGYDFVILKAGSTPRLSSAGKQLGGIEPTFEEDYAAAKAAGLDVGVYFYTYSTTPEEAEKDAELLLGWLDGKTLEYPVYFDLEDPSYEDMSRKLLTDLCVSFISKLQENKYYGALYTNSNWLMNYLQSDKITFLFDIWYARYPAGDEFVWNTESYGENVGMWQYTDKGMIPSVSPTARFDLNYAYKDYPTLIEDMGYNGFS